MLNESYCAIHILKNESISLNDSTSTYRIMSAFKSLDGALLDYAEILLNVPVNFDISQFIDLLNEWNVYPAQVAEVAEDFGIEDINIV